MPGKKYWGETILSPQYLEKYWGECSHCLYGVGVSQDSGRKFAKFGE